jgi:hypothetical protein
VELFSPHPIFSVEFITGMWFLSFVAASDTKPPTRTMNLPEYAEITRDAAIALIGNDELSWRDFNQCEHFEMTTYESHGVKILAICNYTSPAITQYYIQDINA